METDRYTEMCVGVRERRAGKKSYAIDDSDVAAGINQLKFSLCFHFDVFKNLSKVWLINMLLPHQLHSEIQYVYIQQ